MTSPEERRKKRSHDPLVALHYQLSTARTEGDLETIVLADHAGTGWPRGPQRRLSPPGAAIAQDNTAATNLAEAIRRRFRPFGGVEILLPAREPMREPPKPR